MPTRSIWLNNYERVTEVFSPELNTYVYFIDIFKQCKVLKNLECKEISSTEGKLSLFSCELKVEAINSAVSLEVLVDSEHDITQAISVHFSRSLPLDPQLLMKVKEEVSIFLDKNC
ncbi:hypothetical protein IOK49_00365 [Fervidicoccus fontis]|uniref:Uncharacterized protein n=2 Tax=Fervidicoccus fontis TaxID=683846 RepID=I0A2F6_FERFK|nr:hypothetical protein [Fervidicoccus fontis]AFH43163.1 hypothetical protein FFONT_1175 [Fervidicoccus fontis Kam940]MBE9390543.1 hypothetical protein [Fervidicoccus fontis]HEW63943.1 hypothetical protein [Fervidicoccus fontis]